MTRGALVFGDILIAIIAAIAGSSLAWFLREGLRSGFMETRLGTYPRAERPVAYWVSATIFAVGSVGCLLALVYAAADLLFGFRTH